MSARPLVVVWRVTEACQLGCWFCEYNRSLRRSRRSASASDVLAFGRVLGDYTAQTGRRVLVSWLGGEPVLWAPLVEVGQQFHETFGLELSLTTSGDPLGRPGLLEHLAEHYAEITVSVDGLTAFHDATRGAPGLFGRLRASVIELAGRKARRGLGPRLRANVVLMRANLSAFETLCRELASWGIEEITFNALGGQPPGPRYLRERLQPDDVAWLRAALPGVRQRLGVMGLAIRGSDHYLRRLEQCASGERPAQADCHPGASFLFIDEQGRVAPCSFTSASASVPIASLGSAADLAQLPARLAAARQPAGPECHDCRSTQIFGKFEPVEVAL